MLIYRALTHLVIAEVHPWTVASLPAQHLCWVVRTVTVWRDVAVHALRTKSVWWTLMWIRKRWQLLLLKSRLTAVDWHWAAEVAAETAPSETLTYYKYRVDNPFSQHPPLRARAAWWVSIWIAALSHWTNLITTHWHVTLPTLYWVHYRYKYLITVSFHLLTRGVTAVWTTLLTRLNWMVVLTHQENTHLYLQPHRMPVRETTINTIICPPMSSNSTSRIPSSPKTSNPNQYMDLCTVVLMVSDFLSAVFTFIENCDLHG